MAADEQAAFDQWFDVSPSKAALSLNTNPLVNRFAEADDLINTVAQQLHIRDLQLMYEVISPSWPALIVRRSLREIGRVLHQAGLRDKGGHRPFTEVFNAMGKVQPKQLLAAFAQGGALTTRYALN